MTSLQPAPSRQSRALFRHRRFSDLVDAGLSRFFAPAPAPLEISYPQGVENLIHRLWKRVGISPHPSFAQLYRLTICSSLPRISITLSS